MDNHLSVIDFQSASNITVSFNPIVAKELGMVTQACTPRNWKAEAGGSLQNEDEKAAGFYVTLTPNWLRQHIPITQDQGGLQSWATMLRLCSPRA